MIYVDAPIWKFGRMVMCHMLADTEEELDQMARTLGLNPKWKQHRPVVHYDISKSKRVLALAAGAKEIDRKETVAVMRKLRGQNPLAKETPRQ